MSAIQISYFNRNIPIAKLKSQNSALSRQKKLIDSAQLASTSTTIFLKSSKSFTKSIIPNSQVENNKPKKGLMQGVKNRFLDTPETSAKSYSLLKLKDSSLKKPRQPIKIKSESLTRKNNKNNLPEIQTISSINLETPLKLTHKKLEVENIYLKTFLKGFTEQTNDSSVYKGLKITKGNKNINAMNEYIKNFDNLKKKNENSILNKNSKSMSEDFKKIIKNACTNPSIGNEYLHSQYGNFLSNKSPAYENKFKRNFSKKCFGSVLFAKRVLKEDEENNEKYDHVKNNRYTQLNKLKMKWKTIKWILDTKKEVIDRLITFSNKFKGNNEKKTSYTKVEFTRIMKNHGITNDTNLINKIFFVFDENGDGDLTFKEITFGIEMFRDSTFDNKLKAFFDACDIDNSGTISKKEFYDLMRKNIINSEEKIYIKHVVDKIFSSVKLNTNGEMTFDKFKEGCEKVKELQQIITKNMSALNFVDFTIDKDLKKDIQKFNPELNEQLRNKLLKTNTTCVPTFERNFVNMIDKFIDTREKAIEYDKLKEDKNEEEESYEYQDQDNSIFKEEKEFVNFINERVKRDEY